MHLISGELTVRPRKPRNRKPGYRFASTSFGKPREGVPSRSTRDTAVPLPPFPNPMPGSAAPGFGRLRAHVILPTTRHTTSLIIERSSLLLMGILLADVRAIGRNGLLRYRWILVAVASAPALGHAADLYDHELGTYRPLQSLEAISHSLRWIIPCERFNLHHR